MRIYVLLIVCLAGATWAEQDVEEMQEHTVSKRAASITGGSVYIRWGRASCPYGGKYGAQVVYKGVAGGTHYRQSGGGTNYQCLPYNPQWGWSNPSQKQTFRALMYGAEYEIRDNYPFGSRNRHLNNKEVPCTVCEVPRSMMLMIPARTTCPNGWTEEYDGYLMASRYNHPGAKEFVCVDRVPEGLGTSVSNLDGALFYPVEARCGSLSCGNYADGRELTCVVCTK